MLLFSCSPLLLSRYRLSTVQSFICSSKIQYSSVHERLQEGSVQYSSVQYSSVQYSSEGYSSVQYSQYSSVQYSSVEKSTVQQSSVDERLVWLIIGQETVTGGNINLPHPHNESSNIYCTVGGLARYSVYLTASVGTNYCIFLYILGSHPQAKKNRNGPSFQMHGRTQLKSVSSVPLSQKPSFVSVNCLV